jgi:hypothetical protein
MCIGNQNPHIVAMESAEREAGMHCLGMLAGCRNPGLMKNNA